MNTVNSWTRENVTTNNFLGNGGTELNSTSALYDLEYRNYDPVLGRMNGVDPMATKYASLTPYNFSFNDPVAFSDPSGADPADYYFWGNYYTYDDFVPERYDGWQQTIDRSGAGARGFGQSLSTYGGGGSSSGTVMSIGAFFNATINSSSNSFGGSWSNGRADFFKDKEGAFSAGYAYNKEHNTWGNTLTRSAQGSVNLFNDLSALQNPDYRLARASLDAPLSAGQRPDPVDIWSTDKTGVLNALLSHLHFMGHNPDVRTNLRDIVKSFKEPVPWWKGWIPGFGAGGSTGGLAKIFGGHAQWFVGVAGNPNNDAWKKSPANMNLFLSAQSFQGRSFIDGTPSTIYQITVWNGAESDRLIYFNFLTKDIWNKTYNYLKH
ncbi:MAG: hypothetical protein LW721_17785 [Flammeovirgaceae bacterium]|jgi:RHS repeat-associated protein|nr:hypothetical protein [Flammeovirgaceae bacterium]